MLRCEKEKARQREERKRGREGKRGVEEIKRYKKKHA